MSKPELVDAKNIIANFLQNEIEPLFKSGARITMVVRNPSADREPHSGALLVTNDDIDTAIEALQYLKKQERID